MSPAKHRKLTPRQEASAVDTSAERLEELAQEPKLARLVAANPNASAELLLELSHSDDKAVRKACTSNANTPVEALLKLGAQFPEQLLENPVFDLLLLAHPGLFEELPTSTLNSLLKRDQVPVELIRWAWKHRGESTLHSLLMNPNTPVDVVEELCKSKDPEVRMAAKLHYSRKLPGWVRAVHTWKDLSKQSHIDDYLRVTRFDKDFFLLILAGLVSGISARHFDAWSRGCWAGEDRYSSALVNEPGAPEDLLLQILQKALARPSEYGRVPHLESIIFLRRCSQRVLHAALAAAASSPDLRALKCAAECPECPSNILAEIASRDQSFMDYLDRFSLQTDLAANPSTPTSVLEDLAESEFEEARAYVYLHPATPQSTREALLAKEPSIHDKSIAQERFDLANPEHRWDKVTCWSKQRNSQSDDGPNCQGPSRLRDDLFSLEHEVRLNAYWSLRSARSFYYVPFQLDHELAEALVRTKTSSSKSSAIKKWCLASLICPATVLVKNFRSWDWIDRFIVAQHVNTPDEIVRRLIGDGNQLVQRAAKANLERRSAEGSHMPDLQNKP